MGIASAGGAGRALAEWIVNGAPTTDLTGVDIRRFAPFNGNNRWLHDRVAEILGLHYEIPWPNREMTTARPFRRSPVHHLLAESGANFGSRMGWERANFFAPTGQAPTIEYSWGKQNWLPWSAAEQTSTRTAVTVFDQTSFSKYLMVGPDAESALQWLCTADMAVDIGRTVYTGMLNERGTYESDVTVTRTAADEFMIVSSAATTERDKDHITKNLPPGCRAQLVDVTSALAVFGVMGPRSRDLLATLTDADLGDDAFPFGTSQRISLGYSTVRATRITYVGELGWELYVPAEFAVGVYDDLMAAGAAFDVARGGYYAIESLRLEKGYRAFGRELTPNDNPVEAGLLFACKLKTDVDFLGRTAVEKARADGPRRRVVGFSVGSPDAMLWGGELVLRDGVVAGQVTSAAWGETTGSCVGLAYTQGGRPRRRRRGVDRCGPVRGERRRHAAPDHRVAQGDLRSHQLQDPLTDSRTGPSSKSTGSRRPEGIRKTRPGEQGHGTRFDPITVPRCRATTVGRRTSSSVHDSSRCRGGAGSPGRSMPGATQRSGGSTVTRTPPDGAARPSRWASTWSATCLPSSAATSAVSTGCNRFPTANTPGVLVRSAVSTSGPRVAGSMSRPAARASSWSGIQSPVKHHAVAVARCDGRRCRGLRSRRPERWGSR